MALTKVRGQGVTLSNQYCYADNGLSGTGGVQTIPHGLARTPDMVWVQATGAAIGTVSALTWDNVNVYVTFTNGDTYLLKAEIF